MCEAVSTGACESQERVLASWSWNCKQLWNTPHWCWESDLLPVQEQQALSSAPSLYPATHFLREKPQHHRNKGIFLSFHSYKRNLLRWTFSESVLQNFGGSMRGTTKAHKMNSSLSIIWCFYSYYFKVFLCDLETPFILSAPISIMSFSFPS